MTRRPDPYGDAEVRAFIDRAPRRLTFSELERECRRRFGAERAWSRSKIARYWHGKRGVRRGVASRLERDTEVRDFVEDRLGRHSIVSIVTECRRRFGAGRAPSRSAVHRHWQRLRDRIAYGRGQDERPGA